MATAESVKSKIQGLIDTANKATGGVDADLTSAVNTLVAGFGSGGASGVYMAKITLAEYSNYLTINHNLGTTDILYVAAWLENKGDYAFEANGMTLCKMWAKTDITTQRGGDGFCTGYSWQLNNSYASPNAPNGAGYETLTVVDENTVKLPAVASGSTSGYHAGLTFTVFVIAANMGV